VHAGARASHKSIGQLNAAKDRDLKPDLTVGDRILFSEEELTLVVNSMTGYIDALALSIDEAGNGATKLSC
jgi:hypothetical protein